MYQIERVEVITEEAPHISEEDLITLTDAAKLLGVSVQAITGRMQRGELVAVIHPTLTTTYNRPRRYALREEIEQLAKEGVRGPVRHRG